MRLNPEADLMAEDIVNKYKEKEIADIIYQFGEERSSRVIAKMIVENRPFNTCKELGDKIKNIYAKKAKGKTSPSKSNQPKINACKPATEFHK